jgi:hypothetical protein
MFGYLNQRYEANARRGRQMLCDARRCPVARMGGCDQASGIMAVEGWRRKATEPLLVIWFSQAKFCFVENFFIYQYVV